MLGSYSGTIDGTAALAGSLGAVGVPGVMGGAGDDVDPIDTEPLEVVVVDVGGGRVKLCACGNRSELGLSRRSAAANAASRGLAAPPVWGSAEVRA